MNKQTLNGSEIRCPHGYESHIVNVVNTAYPLYITSIVINSLTCFPATIANALVIIAVLCSASLHTPSNMLLCNLAITDLAVGLFVQPTYIISRVAEVENYFNTFCQTWLASRLLASWKTNASLLTLTAISIDRVLAMHLGVRYRLVVSQKRVKMYLVFLWIAAGLLSATRLKFDDVQVFLGITAAIYIICIVVMVASYCKTFRALQSHRLEICDYFQRERSSSINAMHYKKSLYTMLYVVGLVLLCYLPYISLAIPVVITGRSVAERAAWNIVDTFLFLNSSLNPILYYWRIKEIRCSVLEIIHRMCPLCFTRRKSFGGAVQNKSENLPQLNSTLWQMQSIESGNFQEKESTSG